MSNPYDAAQQQIVAFASAGTVADAVGLDGAWMNQLAKQGSIADLTALTDDKGLDASTLISEVEGRSCAVPLMNFIYPLFVNDDIFGKVGVTAPPTDWSEFRTVAGAMKS